jgi:Tol biopolymer transport system component
MFGPFGEPVPFDHINTGFFEDDPSITEDGLEFYFNSDRLGDYDVFVSVRTSVDAAWGPPDYIVAITTADTETSPVISGDGLVLFFTKNPSGPGGDEVLVTTRASRQEQFGPPALVTELNSGETDIGAAPIWDLGRMLLCSRRRDDGAHGTDIYEVDVDLPTLTFGTPQLIGALATDDDECRASGSLDGLEVFFDTDRPGTDGYGIWRATRPTLAGAFSPPELVAQVDTDAAELDPFISADGTTLYFARETANSSNIYFATRERLR